MAIDPEVTRVTRSMRRKKNLRLDSMENHVANIVAEKAINASLNAEVTDFDAIVDGIVSVPKQDEINASALVVRVKATLTTLIAQSDARLAAHRLNLSNLNDLVQADGDHNATEKAEYQAAKDNEV
jgi:hypothetical protein